MAAYKKIAELTDDELDAALRLYSGHEADEIRSLYPDRKTKEDAVRLLIGNQKEDDALMDEYKLTEGDTPDEMNLEERNAFFGTHKGRPKLTALEAAKLERESAKYKTKLKADDVASAVEDAMAVDENAEHPDGPPTAKPATNKLKPRIRRRKDMK